MSLLVCSLQARGMTWVDSKGTNGKPTFHRLANLSWFQRFVIISEISWPEVRSRWRRSLKFAFGKKSPYRQIFKDVFRQDSPPLRSTSCVQISCWPEIGKVVHYLPPPKNFGSLSRSCFCAACTQNLSRPAPDNILRVSEFPKFHLNPFTSGGVMAGRVNIVETCHSSSPSN